MKRAKLEGSFRFLLSAFSFPWPVAVNETDGLVESVQRSVWIGENVAVEADSVMAFAVEKTL